MISVPVYLVELDAERQRAHFSVDVRGTVLSLPLLRKDLAALAGREGKLFALQLEEVPAVATEVAT